MKIIAKIFLFFVFILVFSMLHCFSVPVKLFEFVSPDQLENSVESQRIECLLRNHLNQPVFYDYDKFDPIEKNMEVNLYLEVRE